MTLVAVVDSQGGGENAVRWQSVLATSSTSLDLAAYGESLRAGDVVIVATFDAGGRRVALGSVATGVVTGLAIEYFHQQFGHYFVTAIPDEVAKLDAGVFAGWARTGQTFHVYPIGTTGRSDVCRFFSSSFAPKSSHFYTPFIDECVAVKGNSDWQFEGEVFGVDLPDSAGGCPIGTVPLYRLYNNGQGGAPNHRYTTSTVIRLTMIDAGCIPEGFGIGVIACVPAS